MEAVFSETNWSTYHLLVDAGCELVSPKEQTCCGALHAHTGDVATARKAARQNIEVFEKSSVDYISGLREKSPRLERTAGRPAPDGILGPARASRPRSDG